MLEFIVGFSVFLLIGILIKPISVKGISGFAMMGTACYGLGYLILDVIAKH